MDYFSFVQRGQCSAFHAGLSVELFLDQENYMLKKLSKRAGARLVIHDPWMPPLPDEYGADLRPNTAASFAIHKKDITRD